MGARSKLNVAYAQGCLILAAVVGILAESWTVFAVVLAVLVVGCVLAGEIRPRRRRSGRKTT
ncbi:hypothetical protein BH23PLA1_BH23PLA1_26170 [soil metagenome]